MNPHHHIFHVKLVVIGTLCVAKDASLHSSQAGEEISWQNIQISVNKI